MASTIQLRRGTAAAWTSVNPTLHQGELGLETDTSKLKIGDGTTAWNALAYNVNTVTLSGENYLTLSGSAFTSHPVNLSGTNVTSILTLPKGGTGADLSATGGTSQVLKQTSVGGVITVGQLAASDLSNSTTGSGNVVLATSPTITTAALGSSTATTQSPADNSTKLATTAYVDAAVLGQDFKIAAAYATAAALPASTYSNGSSGVGATLTGVSPSALSVDGSTPSIGDRILVKNQVSTFQNGVYTVTTVGSGIVVFVLTRATDFNTSAKINQGDSLFVVGGSTQAATTWAVNSGSTPTIGTDPITFAQTAGIGSFTSGNGITITGTSIAINTSVTVDKTTAQILTNKTLTAPILTTPDLGTPSAGALGNCTSTTQAVGDSTTKLATTAFVAPAMVICHGITIDGAGSTPSTGSKGYYTFPYAFTINTWYLAADVSGSCVIDIKRSGTSIVGGSGNKPTLSSAQSGNAAPASWTSTSVAAGDILEYNLDNASTLTRVTLTLKGTLA